MIQESFRQAQNLITKSQELLVTVPPEPEIDWLASAAGLVQALSKLPASIHFLVSGQTDKRLSFLPGLEKAVSSLASLSELVIVVDTSQQKLHQVRYEKEEKRALFFLRSQDKPFQTKNISFQTKEPNFDLIITLGAVALETLKHIQEESAALLYEVPILNIDNQPTNTHFGEVNLVQITAASVAEIVTSFLKNWDENLLSKKVACALLTGLIAATRNFQSAKTTPKSLESASFLLNYGVKHHEILKSIYRPKSLPALKLWAKALTQFKFQDNLGLGWALLNPQDFQETEASTQHTSFVLEELVN